jgi:hypothetical protein
MREGVSSGYVGGLPGVEKPNHGGGSGSTPPLPQPASSVERFVGVRRLSGRPVTVVNTTKEFDNRFDFWR